MARDLLRRNHHLRDVERTDCGHGQLAAQKEDRQNQLSHGIYQIHLRAMLRNI